MSVVIYDVETTGIDRHFDQILQFAAVRTDDSLDVIDRFETCCRLLPYIVPSPEALAVNGLEIAEITDPARQSHYAMVSEIHAMLAGWCPTVFLGFNSIRFDEEFLRHAFYQCLYPPYLTNTRPSMRADVLSLARAFAAFHPDKLVVPQTTDGRPTFALRAFSTANGFPDFDAHEAMADVRATLHICKLIAEAAPELWSRFLQFAQRAVAQSFLAENDAFLLFEATAARATYCAMPIAANRNQKQAHIHYCLNLQVDTEALRGFSDTELMAVLDNDRNTVRKVRLNAAPMLCPLDEAPSHLLGGETEDFWEDRARRIKADTGFMARLLNACEAREATYPPSPHVEQQLYELGFWPDADGALMREFHAASWEERMTITPRFTDKRLRQLARRLAFVERPDLFTAADHTNLVDAMRHRIAIAGASSVPWTTIRQAQLRVEAMLQTAPLEQQKALEDYRMYLGKL